MRHPYALHLDLTGRRVVVAGGGPVAARRARELVAAGAAVEVVAPAVCEDLLELLDDLTWTPCDVAVTDVAALVSGAWLVHTATGDAPVDAAIAAACEAAGTWCVRADAAELSAAWTPVTVRRDDVTLSLTAGGDPKRARTLREAASRWLDSGAAPLRRKRSGPGRVVLVGGGPGDVDLLTLRGRRALAEADVVVTDRLGPRGVLAELDDDVEIVDVGKTAGHHPVPQEQINRILVEAARSGRRVVRLKGGDPYVFGRGGEELLACREAGIDVEVVPGVTSAFSVPAAAGIPVTHRGVSRSVTVVDGHEATDVVELAQVGGTLSILMGVSMLPEIADGLIAAGKDPATPVAVVEKGWTPEQRTTRAPLADIAAVAAAAGVRAPAVVVIGGVVEALG